MGRKPKDTRSLSCKEIMTVQDVADFLQVRRETILKLISNQELVATRVGRPWRIRKDDLNTYMINNQNTNIKKGSNTK